MGFLSKLVGNKDSEAERARGSSAPDGAMAAECVHGTLIPRWDRVEDMGHEDRVVSYTCESCNSSLTPTEARAIMASEATRLRV